MIIIMTLKFRSTDINVNQYSIDIVYLANSESIDRKSLVIILSQ